MLFLEKEGNLYENLYLDLLVSYTQTDKFCNLKLLHLTEGKRKLLGLDVLPTLLSQDDQKISSLYQISETILRDAFMDDDLIGTSESQKSLQRKYFELIHVSRENPVELVKAIEGELNGFTFIGENQNLTISDLACFSFLYKHMQSLSNDEKHQHPNVYRWFFYL